MQTPYAARLVAGAWTAALGAGYGVFLTVTMVVLAAMVCVALLARLPTRLTASGAVCFAVSDAMIGIDRFAVGNEGLAVPIWWAYAAAQPLITAGFFFGRAETPAGAAASAASATPAE